MEQSTKTLRDPIYEYISVTAPELLFIDTPWFQRLRHCSQNGPTRLVYPSLVGTRFEHSLGVMELASRMLDSILNESKYTDPSVVRGFLRDVQRDFRLFLGEDVKLSDVAAKVRRLVRMAALCHDLAHFPLSHTLEQAFKRCFWDGHVPSMMPQHAPHEILSAELVRHLGTRAGGAIIEPWLARGVILILLTPSPVEGRDERRHVPLPSSTFQVLGSIICGDYDVDRLDYMQRDGHLGGTSFGVLDIERLIEAMMLVRHQSRYLILPSSRALSTVEAALIERYKEFKWVCYHHKVLYFGEVACELAQALFAQRKVKEQMFTSVSKTLSMKGYRDQYIRALSNPSVPIPPLVLFKGETLNFDRKRLYKIDPSWFISNKETMFLDDTWFCYRCRKYSGRNALFYHEALVERKKCGITTWKDWEQFNRFNEMCVHEANNSKELKKLAQRVNSMEYESIVPGWFIELWQMMLKDEFAESAAYHINECISREVNKSDGKQVRTILRMANWKLFGDFGGVQVVGRDGTPIDIGRTSKMLEQLQNLRGDIPFYVFVVNHADGLNLVINMMKKDRDSFIRTIARGFVLGLYSEWRQSKPNDKPSEVEAAWRKAVDNKKR